MSSQDDFNSDFVRALLDIQSNEIGLLYNEKREMTLFLACFSFFFHFFDPSFWSQSALRMQKPIKKLCFSPKTAVFRYFFTFFAFKKMPWASIFPDVRYYTTLD